MPKPIKLDGLKVNPDHSKVMKSCTPVMDVFGFISLQFTFIDNTKAYAATGLCLLYTSPSPRD